MLQAGGSGGGGAGLGYTRESPEKEVGDAQSTQPSSCSPARKFVLLCDHYSVLHTNYSVHHRHPMLGRVQTPLPSSVIVKSVLQKTQLMQKWLTVGQTRGSSYHDPKVEKIFTLAHYSWFAPWLHGLGFGCRCLRFEVWNELQCLVCMCMGWMMLFIFHLTCLFVWMGSIVDRHSRI